MKYYLCLILLFCLGDMAMAIEPSTQPNECQQRLIDRGYGMFIHFGINTFNGLEWSDGTTPASAYNPTQLDCDQWIRVARDAGFRYVVLTAKHHDGFCLWDSALTDYDVASSPVKTDVVGQWLKLAENTASNLPFTIPFGIGMNPVINLPTFLTISAIWRGNSSN